MKKKYKKKKYQDLEDFKNLNENNNNNLLDGSEYKTDIEELYSLFPDFDRNILYDIYISKDRNFILTKNAINEILNYDSDNKNKNKNEDNNNFIKEKKDSKEDKEDEKTHNFKKKKKNKGIDISNKSNFIIISQNDEYSESPKMKRKKKYTLSLI